MVIFVFKQRVGIKIMWHQPLILMQETFKITCKINGILEQPKAFKRSSLSDKLSELD